MGEEVRKKRRRFVGEDQDALEAKRKNVKDKETKTVIYQVVPACPLPGLPSRGLTANDYRYQPTCNVVSQARGTEGGRSSMVLTDGSRQLLGEHIAVVCCHAYIDLCTRFTLIKNFPGRFRLPRNVQNGDSVNLSGEDYVVVRTTINFMLNKGKFRKEHYLVVEKSFSSILDNFDFNMLRP